MMSSSIWGFVYFGVAQAAICARITSHSVFGQCNWSIDTLALYLHIDATWTMSIHPCRAQRNYSGLKQHLQEFSTLQIC